MVRSTRWRRCGDSLAIALAIAGLAGCSGDETVADVVVGNQPPRIEWLRLDPDEPANGETIHAKVRAVDPEADRIDVRFAWEVGGVPRMDTGPTLELKGLAKGTPISVTAIASDGVADSEPVHQMVRIRNQRPRLTQARIEPWAGVARGETLVVKPAGTDGDDDTLAYRYRWHVNGSAVAGDTESFSTAHLSPGDVVYARVVATDGEVDSDPVDTARVRVTGPVPRIVSSPVGLAADGSFRYRVEVEHLDGVEALRFGLRAAPAGMDVNPATGEIVWTPAPGQIGDFPVEVEVVDSRGTKAVQAFRITVGSAVASPPARPADD
jgi:hypothetical protein